MTRVEPRPPQPSGPSAWTVGVDVGGTKVDAVIVDRSHHVGARTRVSTVRGEAGVTASILTCIDELTAAVGTRRGALHGIGIGVPGAVDTLTGSVRQAVNLEVEDFDLAAAITSATGADTRVENDVNVAAFGAYVERGLESSETLVYLNLGTGMGVGVVTGGRIWGGATGAAGEIGHLPFAPGGLLCSCGMHGCLERYASGSGIAAYGRGPAEEVFARFDENDEDRQIAELFADALAFAIRVVGQAYDPDVIVVGGSTGTAAAKKFLPRVRERLCDWEGDSPFFASLHLLDRVSIARDAAPAAVGAALWYQSSQPAAVLASKV